MDIKELKEEVVKRKAALKEYKRIISKYSKKDNYSNYYKTLVQAKNGVEAGLIEVENILNKKGGK